MFEVYRHHDTARVGLIDGILKDSGIETFLKNWAGSNITEVPIPAIYPSVCVLNEADIPIANNVITEFLETKKVEADNWICGSCGEEVDGFLSECWSCQNAKI